MLFEAPWNLFGLHLIVQQLNVFSFSIRYCMSYSASLCRLNLWYGVCWMSCVLIRLLCILHYDVALLVCYFASVQMNGLTYMKHTRLIILRCIDSVFGASLDFFEPISRQTDGDDVDDK